MASQTGINARVILLTIDAPSLNNFRPTVSRLQTNIEPVDTKGKHVRLPIQRKPRHRIDMLRNPKHYFAEVAMCSVTTRIRVRSKPRRANAGTGGAARAYVRPGRRCA
ncbi:hypothetical protein F3J14_10875 [Burkholderia sp. Tr-862]|uniref:hypothetical protein n=1 Tax=Burkholderia sp. Tr-862 TaxID=2608331 RepID=UPI00141A29FA|nr:hypothetical protein [Burkholderia sp. Tr-862]NIF41384.1 hypothetical protein [Burkholderia sp. Tr-862]